MYSERAIIEFHDTIAQSVRLNFLANMAAELEKAGETSAWPFFSIDLHGNGQAEILILHPQKRDALWAKLREGNMLGLYQLMSPKNLSG